MELTQVEVFEKESLGRKAYKKVVEVGKWFKLKVISIGEEIVFNIWE